MPEKLKPLALAVAKADIDNDQQDNLRLLSRSPHPYHRQKWELLEPSDRLISNPAASTIPPQHSDDVRDQLLPVPPFAKDSSPSTDSGTEADDENYVKRLPAPRAKLHKGLRGRPEALSGSGTPTLTPTTAEGDPDGFTLKNRGKSREQQKRRRAENAKRRKELIRRASEVLILSALGKLVLSNPSGKPFVAIWRTGELARLRHCAYRHPADISLELLASCAVYALLLALYPLRVTIWAYTKRESPKRSIPLSIPASFDPAPILYPQLLPVLVAFLTAANVKDAVLPNIILALASLPRTLIPDTLACSLEVSDPLHWLLSCVPLLVSETHSTRGNLDTLALLYPLHQSLSVILYKLTTTSLLPAELQLLSISLINLLVLAASPQAIILQALLWMGGLGILIFCGPAIRWSISLARVPKWRFRRDNSPTYLQSLLGFFVYREPKEYGFDTDGSAASGYTTDEEGGKRSHASRHRKSMSSQAGGLFDGEPLKRTETIAGNPMGGYGANPTEEPEVASLHSRSRSFPFAENLFSQTKTHTPSGRRKRSASTSVQYFFALTQAQANERKWIYAAWVYLWVVAIILGGIRWYVQQYALGGNEPVGWALGYVFGDFHQFRLQVLLLSLERWICLPVRPDSDAVCHLGWVEHLRHVSLGTANTRLLLAAYWVGIIVVGLAVVFRLSPYYEVDTRRKIFHFMMVSMFLPTIYIDPAWCALALAIALAIFLLLDLLRASQLPPLSKPITNFLHPYTDGRDHCGPVVISHIFLLIGCAIPLWLSLASLPRTGADPLQGWEIPTRELSMVAGVVCVGLGDAAASLIGRRYGHHKWLWKGGKSLEGSVAFAVAVFAGLMAANLWLKLGGWVITGESGLDSIIAQRAASTSSHQAGFDAVLANVRNWRWSDVVFKTGTCATVASLTEAVLTGGNDNVVVPVVLWTCVKSTGL